MEGKGLCTAQVSITRRYGSSFGRPSHGVQLNQPLSTRPAHRSGAHHDQADGCFTWCTGHSVKERCDVTCDRTLTSVYTRPYTPHVPTPTPTHTCIHAGVLGGVAAVLVALVLLAVWTRRRRQTDGKPTSTDNRLVLGHDKEPVLWAQQPLALTVLAAAFCVFPMLVSVDDKANVP